MKAWFISLLTVLYMRHSVSRACVREESTEWQLDISREICCHRWKHVTSAATTALFHRNALALYSFAETLSCSKNRNVTITIYRFNWSQTHTGVYFIFIFIFRVMKTDEQKINNSWALEKDLPQEGKKCIWKGILRAPRFPWKSLILTFLYHL